MVVHLILIVGKGGVWLRQTDKDILSPISALDNLGCYKSMICDWTFCMWHVYWVAPGQSQFTSH